MGVSPAKPGQGLVTRRRTVESLKQFGSFLDLFLIKNLAGDTNRIRPRSSSRNKALQIERYDSILYSTSTRTVNVLPFPTSLSTPMEFFPCSRTKRIRKLYEVRESYFAV